MNHRMAVAAAALFVAGCSSAADQAAGPGKYEQTWATSYGDTTCSDWTGTMDAHQRFVAAADMLTGARKSDGADTVPADALVVSFENDLDEGCAISTMAITEAAAALYVIGRDQYAP